MRVKKIVLCACIAMTMSGCATIIKHGEQQITVKSVPEAADISISNRAGEKIHSGKTPATVTLKKGAGYFKSEDYTVVISKDGYASKTVHVTGSVNGWYIGGNILFGGLIGWLVVDPLTGAMYTLNPETVDANLVAGSVGYEKSEGALTILLAQNVSAEAMRHAHRIDAP